MNVLNELRITFLSIAIAIGGLFLGYSSHACAKISCCDYVIYKTPQSKILASGYANATVNTAACDSRNASGNNTINLRRVASHIILCFPQNGDYN